MPFWCASDVCSLEVRHLVQNLMHDPPVHVGESVVPALEAESQTLVIDAEDVQQGRVQIVDVHGVFDHVVGEFVGLSERKAGLDACARKPPGKAAAVVIAASVPSSGTK